MTGESPEHAAIRKDAHALIDRLRTAIPNGTNAEVRIVALVAPARAYTEYAPKWGECVWDSVRKKAAAALKEKTEQI